MTSNNITVLINGEPMLGYTSFRGQIIQQLNNHHFFELSFSSFLNDRLGGVPFQNHGTYQNQEISVFSANGKLQFTGIILSVQHHNSKTDNENGITLKGTSPTFLLENTIQCKSFDEGTSFKDIMSTVIDGYPTNRLHTNYGRETSLPLGYTVQYNESDWHFVKRMSERYGIYTYYSGTEFNIGKNTDTVQQWQGTLGVDVKSFEVKDDLTNPAFAMQYKDWTVNQNLSSHTSEANANIPDTLTPTINRATEAFTKEGNYYYPYLQDDHSGQQMLDYMTKVQAQGKLSNMITVTGRTEILGLSLCDQIEVIGHNYINALSDQPFGIYEITGITHVFNNHGYYHNDIQGVIRGLEHPPYSNVYATSKIQAMSATVIDNNDTQGLNRLKLQFPWQVEQNSTTPWIRCANTHAGATHGSYIVAEKGDEVWCTFQGNNPECPLVMGATYNQSSPSPFYDADNNKKAFTTRSGNVLISNDEDGSIMAQNKSGSTVILQDDGNMSLHAPNNLVLDAKNIIMKATNAIKVISVPDKEGEGDGIIQMTAQKEIIAEAIDEVVALKAKLDLLLESTDAKVGLSSKEDTTINSDGAIQITAKDTFHAHGSDMGVLTGGKVKVNKA